MCKIYCRHGLPKSLMFNCQLFLVRCTCNKYFVYFYAKKRLGKHYNYFTKPKDFNIFLSFL